MAWREAYELPPVSPMEGLWLTNDLVDCHRLDQQTWDGGVDTPGGVGGVYT